MIPKVIHYCWFGDGKMSTLHRRCIESWEKYCPGYKIQLWSEDNSDIDNDYCRAAIRQRKWAFVADWVRFDVLYKHGGIYLDTDLELIRPIDSLLGGEDCVIARESGRSIATAFIACGAADPVMAKAREIMLQDLARRKIFVSSPLIVMEALAGEAGRRSIVLPAASFYPFNPFDHDNPNNARQFMYGDVTADTFGVHHYGVTASWGNRPLRRLYYRLMKLARLRASWNISFDAFRRPPA